MAHLQDILYKVSLRSVHGDLDKEVLDLQTDSRKVGPHSLFIALRGTHTDAHQFIPQVTEAGTPVVVCEELPAVLQDGVTYMQVGRQRRRGRNDRPLNFYAASLRNSWKAGRCDGHQWEDDPSPPCCASSFTALGHRWGLLSTVQNHIGDKVVPATHTTTPDAITLNALLLQMVDDAMFSTYSWRPAPMPSTSTGSTGLRYMGDLFSNITHDHLDYHKTFDEYIRVKKSLCFDSLPSEAFAISNADDDKRGR